MEIPVCRTCGNYVRYDKPKKLKKKVLNQEFKLCVCQKCLLEKFTEIGTGSTPASSHSLKLQHTLSSM